MISLEKQKARAKRSYQSNREKRLVYAKRYRAENAEKCKAVSAAWRKANPEKRRAAWQKLKGLPLPTHPRPELCECCGQTDTRALALDHCRETGVHRGWLCGECNMGIGKLGDNLRGVQRAVNYLMRTFNH
jgi:hypothetical protein